MAKGRVQRPEAAPRPLKLDPERAERVDRPPYAIVDIGSNSVRLLVYDQLGRAPMPRFNEKSLLPPRARGSPRPAPSRPTAFAAPSRRCGGFAPSPTRWASAESTPWRPRPCAAPPTGRSSPRRSRRSAASRFASSAGPKKRGSRRSASSPASSGRSGRSATWAAAASKSRKRSTIMSESAGSVCRSAPCRSRRCCRGPFGGEAPDRRDPAPEPAARARAGRCSIRSAAAGGRWPRRTWKRSARRSKSCTAIRSAPSRRANSRERSRGSPRRNWRRRRA